MTCFRAPLREISGFNRNLHLNVNQSGIRPSDRKSNARSFCTIRLRGHGLRFELESSETVEDNRTRNCLQRRFLFAEISTHFYLLPRYFSLKSFLFALSSSCEARQSLDMRVRLSRGQFDRLLEGTPWQPLTIQKVVIEVTAQHSWQRSSELLGVWEAKS